MSHMILLLLLFLSHTIINQIPALTAFTPFRVGSKVITSFANNTFQIPFDSALHNTITPLPAALGISQLSYVNTQNNRMLLSIYPISYSASQRTKISFRLITLKMTYYSKLTITYFVSQTNDPILLALYLYNTQKQYLSSNPVDQTKTYNQNLVPDVDENGSSSNCGILGCLLNLLGGLLGAVVGLLSSTSQNGIGSVLYGQNTEAIPYTNIISKIFISTLDFTFSGPWIFSISSRATKLNPLHFDVTFSNNINDPKYNFSVIIVNTSYSLNNYDFRFVYDQLTVTTNNTFTLNSQKPSRYYMFGFSHIKMKTINTYERIDLSLTKNPTILTYQSAFSFNQYIFPVFGFVMVKCNSTSHQYLILEQQQCHITCPPGYYSNSSNICLLCSVPCVQCLTFTYCTKCNPLDKLVPVNGNCVLCSDGTFFNDSSCVACKLGCTTCQNLTYCLSCSASMKLILVNNQCVSCQSGTYFDTLTSTCKNCPTGCTQCQNSSYCTSCSVPMKRVLNLNMCVVCYTGTFYESSTCKPCPTGCKTCQNNSYCTSCQVSMKLILVQNTCVSCASNEYFSLHNTPILSSCITCPIGCTTCTSPSYCLTCNHGSKYYFENNFCYECNYINKFFDHTTNLCSICSQGCLICSSFSHCTKCDESSNYQLFAFSCRTCLEQQMFTKANKCQFIYYQNVKVDQTINILSICSSFNITEDDSILKIMQDYEVTLKISSIKVQNITIKGDEQKKQVCIEFSIKQSFTNENLQISYINKTNTDRIINPYYFDKITGSFIQIFEEKIFNAVQQFINLLNEGSGPAVPALMLTSGISFFMGFIQFAQITSLYLFMDAPIPHNFKVFLETIIISQNIPLLPFQFPNPMQNNQLQVIGKQIYQQYEIDLYFLRGNLDGIFQTLAYLSVYFVLYFLFYIIKCKNNIFKFFHRRMVTRFYTNVIMSVEIVQIVFVFNAAASLTFRGLNHYEHFVNYITSGTIIILIFTIILINVTLLFKYKQVDAIDTDDIYPAIQRDRRGAEMYTFLRMICLMFIALTIPLIHYIYIPFAVSIFITYQMWFLIKRNLSKYRVLNWFRMLHTIFFLVFNLLFVVYFVLNQYFPDLPVNIKLRLGNVSIITLLGIYLIDLLVAIIEIIDIIYQKLVYAFCRKTKVRLSKNNLNKNDLNNQEEIQQGSGQLMFRRNWNEKQTTAKLSDIDGKNSTQYEVGHQPQKRPRRHRKQTVQIKMKDKRQKQKQKQKQQKKIKEKEKQKQNQKQKQKIRYTRARQNTLEQDIQDVNMNNIYQRKRNHIKRAQITQQNTYRKRQKQRQKQRKLKKQQQRDIEVFGSSSQRRSNFRSDHQINTKISRFQNFYPKVVQREIFKQKQVITEFPTQDVLINTYSKDNNQVRIHRKRRNETTG